MLMPGFSGAEVMLPPWMSSTLPWPAGVSARSHAVFNVSGCSAHRTRTSDLIMSASLGALDHLARVVTRDHASVELLCQKQIAGLGVDEGMDTWMMRSIVA